MDPQQNPIIPSGQQIPNQQPALQQPNPNQEPTQRDAKKVIKFAVIFGVVSLVILILVAVFNRGPSGDFETRTQDWANFDNDDFGVSFRYPPQWNLRVGTQEIVDLSINAGDGVERQVAIEVTPNPDWLELDEWLTRTLGATQFEAYRETELSGRNAYILETAEEFTYYLNSGPRIFAIRTKPGNPQDVLDLLTSLQVDVIALGDATDNPAGELIHFEPVAFKILFDKTNLADTRNIDNRPAIYGDSEADAKIQELAENRGYLLRSEYTGTTGTINGLPVASQIVADWTSLEKAATAAGHNLDVTSGIRNIEQQRGIFKGRLTTACANQKGSDCSLSEIKAGSVDNIIDSVLETTSPPGYSRHHSGYTLDIQHTGQGGIDEFANSDGYTWLSNDNFANAKRFGFIPSYPEGVERQGPDPEPWEYVWVGRDFLRQFE